MADFQSDSARTIEPAPKLSHIKAAILGLQHLLAMYSGDVLIPLLVGAALHFNAAQMTYLVSVDIFMWDRHVTPIETNTFNRDCFTRRLGLCGRIRRSTNCYRD